MAVILVGEIVNSCDTVTGFNQGNISGDDDFVEGVGAIGLKIAASYQELYTTSLGATAPYDFSVGGAEEGYHFILWFNTKLAIPATGGLRCIFGNGTDRAEWNVDPTGFYKGGFLTKMIDPTRDFDTINAGTWSLSGNPAQLSNITTMGGGIETVPTIMGNFNSGQLDQMTIGLGLRISGGTGGSPDTFEDVRVADEDTEFYGWWSSSNGAIIGKGKLFIGPETGSLTSVFDDDAFSVIFADELVAADFYEINVRGAGTDVTWDLGGISSANPDTARWGLTVDPTTNSFTDTNGIWVGARNLSLQDNSTLDGTTMINCDKLYQSGATISNCTILAANTADGVAFMESDRPDLISNSSFTFSDGHALEFTSEIGTTAFTFTNNSFTSYGVSGSTDAAIYNNSNKHIVINVSGGDTPTIRNGGTSTTEVNNTVVLTLTGLVDDSEVRIFTTGMTEVYGEENTSGGESEYAYTYDADNSLVYIMIIHKQYDNIRIDYTLTSTNASIPIQQTFDRWYDNP